MSKLIEAAEAAVGALENFVDRKVDAGEDGSGVQAIVDFLKDEIKNEKRMIRLGSHKITEADLHTRMSNKLSKAHLSDIIKSINEDLDAGN